MTYPIEPVRDIMKRTMRNLQFVEQNKSSEGPFEVTQLINSFLGAVAHPWEELDPDLRCLTLEAAKERGWPSIDAERPSDRTPQSIGDLIRNLRNAIAHGNITYWDKDGDIFALQLVSYYVDENTGTRRRSWGTVVTVECMRGLLDCFVELADELYTKRHVKQPRLA